MSAALQVFYTRFDTQFLKLPPQLQARIESRIDQTGLRLATFPHHRLSGSDRCRLRVGDYRVIYGLDAAKNVIYPLAIGHRREIYRDL